jgi:uncharacterized membrane protein
MATTATVLPSAGERPRSRWRQEYWVLLLVIYCVGFSVYGILPYSTLNPDESRAGLRPELLWLQYPVLVAHVFGGVVAESLAWVQVWPWLRETHPRLHRRLGRVYYFAGVFPACTAAFGVAVISEQGQGVRAVLLTMATLWMITAVCGLRAVLNKQYDAHRRWMLRNVALTTATIDTRVIYPLFILVTHWLLGATYDNQNRLLQNEASATALWFPILVHLLYVEWYLLRPRRRRPVRAPAPASSPQSTS